MNPEETVGGASIEKGDLGAVAEKLDSVALAVVRSVIGELLRAPERAVEALFRLSDAELGELLRHAEQVGREKGLSAATADDLDSAEPVPRAGLQISPRSRGNALTTTVTEWFKAKLEH